MIDVVVSLNNAAMCPVCGNGVPLNGPPTNALWSPCSVGCQQLLAQHGDRADVAMASAHKDD